MNINFKNNNDFIHFKKSVKDKLNNREIIKVDNPDLVPAAVMMLVFNRGGSPYVLLTKRTEKVKSHKGQVSFPGGVFDEEDKEIIKTAFRETWEEVGIPGEKIELLGQFDDYISPAGFKVSSFIGSFDYPFQYKVSRDEIEEIIEAPLSVFVNLDYERKEDVVFMSKDYTMYYYDYMGFDIWGMTARVLTDFSQDIVLKQAD
ncbi:NUDIX hydrolase [Spirochaetota bacterium]